MTDRFRGLEERSAFHRMVAQHRTPEDESVECASLFHLLFHPTLTFSCDGPVVTLSTFAGLSDDAARLQRRDLLFGIAGFKQNLA
jgi:hypothetical protein